jgi:membrane protein implicated in regulation of membrane protease activity
MNFSDFFLLCFGIGTAWAIISLLLGGVHFGHGSGHVGHAHVGHGHAGHGHTGAGQHAPHWVTSLLNPSCIAVFLAWFGGAGYLLNKYSGLMLLLNLVIAGVFGLVGAWILARFLTTLMKHERVMNPADYDMVGVLGRVSSTIRADGVGEVIYLHEGVRRSFNAKSETGVPIARGEEVIVTHFEKGIAFVRTWEAMTQRAGDNRPETIA